MIANNHWEPNLHKRLNQVLESNKDTGAYLVFDFDQTCITGDIEEQFFYYQLKHFLYALDADQLYQVMASPLTNTHRPVVGYGQSMDALMADIQAAYAHLLKLPSSQRQLDPHYQAFLAKALLFYQTAFSYLDLEQAKSLPTYWFAGLKQSQIQAGVKDIFQTSLQARGENLCPFQAKTHQSPAYIPGQFGPVTSSFQEGLVVPTEILDLLTSLPQGGQAAYLISASPRCLVEALHQTAPFQGLFTQVYGMPHSYQSQRDLPYPQFIQKPAKERDKDPLALANLLPNQIKTKGAGKTQLILTNIAPLHQNHAPLALFGDSMGDYDMLTHFEGKGSLSILFNRNLRDQTQELAAKARASFGQAQAQYFLQGKDFKKGTFRLSQDSLF